MHDEILNHQQKELLPLLSKFKREYYLVGGTAIALQNSAEHAPNCYWRTSQSLGVRPVMALNVLKNEDSLVNPDANATDASLASGCSCMMRLAWSTR